MGGAHHHPPTMAKWHFVANDDSDLGCCSGNRFRTPLTTIGESEIANCVKDAADVELGVKSGVESDRLWRRPSAQAAFDPQAIAVEYYFGDLGYWQLPAICIKALERGFDGRALRRIAGLVNLNPVRGRLLRETDIRADEIDSAFREMGVNAPMPKDEARLVLATDAAKRALAGETNVFNEATHIRIHICDWRHAPPELQPIVDLSEKSEHAPSWQWKQLEKQLREAMTQFLNSRK